MTTVTVSTKYQVVIPRDVRESLHLKPGKKYQVLSFGDCIEFIPVRTAKEMRGVLKGVDATIVREGDRL